MARKPSILSPEEANLQCPNCGSLEKGKYGKDWFYPELQRYKCKNCGRLFLQPHQPHLKRHKVMNKMLRINAVAEYLTYKYIKYNWYSNRPVSHQHCHVKAILHRNNVNKTDFYRCLQEIIKKIRELEPNTYPQFTKIHNLISKIEGTGTKQAVKIIRQNLSEKAIFQLIQILFQN